MRTHYQKLLTQKDMEDSPKELSDFEKLVEVCRVARDLYYQENPQEALKTNHIHSTRPVSDQVGQVHDESWRMKSIQEDAALFSKREILVGSSTSCNSREELCKGSETKRSNIDSISFDQVGQVYDKSWGKKPIEEDGGLFSKDEILLSSSTSCISKEELFMGSKPKNGESSSARFCKLKIKRSGDDHDYVGGKEVEKWNGYNRDYLNKKSDQFIHGITFDCVRKRSRKFFDSCEDDQDYDYSQKKKPRSTCNARLKVARVTSPLAVEFNNAIHEMGGTDVKLIIQKNLFSTDMDCGQNRFSIPMKQIRENFLTDEEENILDQRFNDKHVVPMMVPLIEPSLRKTEISLRKWAVNSSYVLSCPWNDIRDRNALKVGMEMQLWSFRVEGALNLALVKVSSCNN